MRSADHVSTEQVVEAIWSGVTDRTRVLFLSHITSPTALTLPVDELVRRAREAGIITVIDGAHAAGQVPLDLEALGADFYSANCHKWMMSPKGAGFLYARREMQHLLEPLIGGRRHGTPQGSPLVAEHQYQGTRDVAAFLSVPAAIQFMQDHDWPQVRQACHELVRYARQEVAELTGAGARHPRCRDVVCTDGRAADPALRPGGPPQPAARRVRDRDSAHRWDGHSFVRLSVQGYNTRADVERLVEALGTLLPEVALEQ